jgi:hypothetical protein
MTVFLHAVDGPRDDIAIMSGRAEPALIEVNGASAFLCAKLRCGGLIRPEIFLARLSKV